MSEKLSAEQLERMRSRWYAPALSSDMQRALDHIDALTAENERLRAAVAAALSKADDLEAYASKCDRDSPTWTMPAHHVRDEAWDIADILRAARQRGGEEE